MRNLIVLTVVIFLAEFVIGQQVVFVKKWDRRFGGTDRDGIGSFHQTNDGGYIIGGSSTSNNNGDKTQPTQGGWDCWIVKTDSNGVKKWDKSFGGNGSDGVASLQQTKDGGYILGGGSSSGVSGDKTQPTRGGYDYWIVKTDSLGNKQWDKRFGGTFDDILYALQQTNDGGYILGGTSNSGISGDKTQDNWDTTYFQRDGWIVKIDSLGNKQWDKRFGGTDYEDIRSLIQTDGGGYLLGCYSASDSNGDKTQPSLGFGDFWIVKIDSLGNKEWDKSYGGPNSDQLSTVLQTSDGGYLLGGDYFWIVKIDSVGNIQWEKSYDGDAELSAVTVTSDRGYLLSGSSGYLIQPPDKSEPNLGSQQAWIVKTDSLGNKQWDKTIFTLGHDWCVSAIETEDGCYVVGVNTEAGIGGYISEPNRDGIDSTGDYWIAKFCFEPLGINETSNNSNVLVYPNPFTSNIAISLQKENLNEATFTISNMLGQVVFTKAENNLASSYTKILDLSYLPNGVYLVEVIADGERVVKKVVKE